MRGLVEAREVNRRDETYVVVILILFMMSMNEGFTCSVKNTTNCKLIFITIHLSSCRPRPSPTPTPQRSLFQPFFSIFYHLSNGDGGGCVVTMSCCMAVSL
jgi:hypothetical protein